MIVKEVNTFTAQIYMGLTRFYTTECVDYTKVETSVCKFCDEAKIGVTMEKIQFIYPGSMEHGARISLINYPRFPREEEDIKGIALKLAWQLLNKYDQNRLSIVFPRTTVMLERDEPKEK